MALVIYTKPGCPSCDMARKYYTDSGVPFTEYDAQKDLARREEMLEASGGDLTTPCIVLNGEHVQSGWGNPLRGCTVIPE